MKTTAEIKKDIARRKRQLEQFDKLPKEKQAEKTKAGLNPHESKATRDKRKKANLEERKRQFKLLPEKIKEIHRALELDPAETEQIETKIRSY